MEALERGSAEPDVLIANTLRNFHRPLRPSQTIGGPIKVKGDLCKTCAYRGQRSAIWPLTQDCLGFAVMFHRFRDVSDR